MRDLLRAATQFAAEVTIHACERILEALAAQQPLHDEPLPNSHTEFWPDELSEFSTADYLRQTREDIRNLAEQTQVPTLYSPEHP